MIKIRPIHPDETVVAKRIVYRVAHEIFNDQDSLEESIAYQEARGELKDMDDIQKNYFENGGVFLVMEDEDRIIGTGAIRKMDEGICELRRLWFLSEYHGWGFGYRMILELLRIARELGYVKIRLETAPVHQQRAYELYKRLGFYEIPKYHTTHEDDIAMEMSL